MSILASLETAVMCFFFGIEIAAGQNYLFYADGYVYSLQYGLPNVASSLAIYLILFCLGVAQSTAAGKNSRSLRTTTVTTTVTYSSNPGFGFAGPGQQQQPQYPSGPVTYSQQQPAPYPLGSAPAQAHQKV